MLLTLLLALGLAGAALALFARAAVLHRIRADENVGRIAAYGFPTGAAAPRPKRAPVFPRLAEWLASTFASGVLAKRQAQLRKTLLAAGAWRTSAAAVQGYRMMLSVVLGVLAVWVALDLGLSPIIAFVLGGYGFVVGWVTPMFLIKARARQRLERIEVELPELIDRLVVTLEAGIGFNAALHRSAERMSGPLGEELRLTLHEQELGLTVQGALSNLLDRCEVPSIRSFVRAVAQSEQLGISIAQVMRDLAHEIRQRRRQIIEERAHKAPIKILFPLAFLILPSLLIVVLFPGIYNIVQTVGGGF